MAKVIIFFVLLFATFMAADNIRYDKGHSSTILAVFCGIMTFLRFFQLLFLTEFKFEIQI